MYHYLASPYTHPDPSVREHRYFEALRALGWLYKHGFNVHSSIVQNHPLAVLKNLPDDINFWRDYNRAMIRFSAGVFILMLEGWRESAGIKEEIEFANFLGVKITGINVLIEGGYRLT